MNHIEFHAKINKIGGGSRFLITIPKKLVKSKLIDPSKPYLVILKEEEDNG